MPSHTGSPPRASLRQVLESVSDTHYHAVEPNGGRRTSPRVKPDKSAYVRVLTPTAPVTLESYSVRDISNRGLGIRSTNYLPPGSIQRVEVCSQDLGWTGDMRVTYCKENNSCFIVGLEALDGDCSIQGEASIHVKPQMIYRDEYEHISASPEAAWLERSREEIAASFRRYNKARQTFGLFGTRIDAAIDAFIKGLPEGNVDKARASRRSQNRMNTRIQGCMILVGGQYWHGLSVQFLNISKAGAGVVINGQAVEALPPELRAPLNQPDCRFRTILGMNSPQEVLWLPARTVYFRPDDDERLFFAGLEFERKAFDLPGV